MCRSLPCLAFAALVVPRASSAYALDVNKKIAAPGQLLVVWSTISEFCSIKDWHPAIADCKESKEGGDTFRVLTLKDNGGTIKEKLDRLRRHELQLRDRREPAAGEELLGQALGRARRARSRPHRDPLGCDLRRQWQERRRGQEVISDIFMAGLKSIKQKTMPPEGTPAATRPRRTPGATGPWSNARSSSPVAPRASGLPRRAR